jgi:hypothetical protein
MAVNVLFLDANTVWHRRIAEAIGAMTQTTAYLPRTGLIPGFGVPEAPVDGACFTPLMLPRGWASGLAWVVQPFLARNFLRRHAQPTPVAILASPAYRKTASYLNGRMPFVYYCADDYRSYQGWRGDVAAAEADICRGAALSVFVSESLRERAVGEYGIDPKLTFVSPNATEPRFVGLPTERLPLLDERRGPVLGILGALTDRLDVDLVRRAAELEEVGTLLVAGSVSSEIATREAWLHANPKIVVTGQLDHRQMHKYARAMDAALIPYRRTPLNYHCSPMRLYDHLASGVPIFATDACDQINRLNADYVTVAPANELPLQIAAGIGAPRSDRSGLGIFWADRAAGLCEKLVII